MISVVIPNYNGGEVLPRCLGALQGQTIKNVEVILVDNGSADDSLETARRLWPGIKVISFSQNRGFAAAVNAGIKAAAGRYVALLNNDVEPEPEWLAELCRELDKHPGAFGVGSKLLLDPERDRINVVGIKLKPYAESSSIGSGQKDRGQFDRPGEVFGISAGAALFRREVFEEVGLFDEDFFAYLEDVDLCFRARLLGYSFRYAPSARAYHLKGWTTRNKMNKAFEIRQNARNTLYYQVKNIPAETWRKVRARLIIRHLELFFRHTVQHLHKGEALPYLSGQLEFMSRIRKVRDKRRQVQAQKKAPDQTITAWLGREVLADQDPVS
ncbi:MAG: glycosyltransferase family 2 protein [Pseudomonadota bacterium]